LALYSAARYYFSCVKSFYWKNKISFCRCV